jgi:hypothetical protein
LRKEHSSKAFWQCDAGGCLHHPANICIDLRLRRLRVAAISLGDVAEREGCRYAITFQTATGQGQDASIEAVVQQFAMGMVKTTDNPQDIFVKYYSTSNLTTAIGSGGNVPGNIVEVSVQGVSWSWIAPLSGSYGGAAPFFRSTTPISLNIFSSDILGGFPAGLNLVTE